MFKKWSFSDQKAINNNASQLAINKVIICDYPMKQCYLLPILLKQRLNLNPDDYFAYIDGFMNSKIIPVRV